MLNNNFFYCQVVFGNIYVCRKKLFFFTRIFFTIIFVTRIFLTSIFFVKIFLIWIFSRTSLSEFSSSDFFSSEDNVYIINIMMNLFFFNNIFIFLWKHLRIKIFNSSKNRINQNHWSTNKVRFLFWYFITLKICINLSIVEFYSSF